MVWCNWLKQSRTRKADFSGSQKNPLCPQYRFKTGMLAPQQHFACPNTTARPYFASAEKGNDASMALIGICRLRSSAWLRHRAASVQGYGV
jgi:hypothetical protein